MKRYRTMENVIRDVVRKSRIHEQKMPQGQKFGSGFIEKDQSDQIVAGTYKTKNFEMCPKAQKLFVNINKDQTVTNPDKLEKMAILHDQLFALEKQAIAKEQTSKDDTKEAEQIAQKIYMLGDDLKLGDRLQYVNDHIKLIKSYEMPDQMVFDNPSPDVIRKRLTEPPSSRTKEPEDRDIDNTKFLISRNIKAQRKLKIIDAD
jgi:hypothetical protein